MNPMYISISRHFDLEPNKSETFTVDFFSNPITTTVTATPSVVRYWLNRVLSTYRFHRHKLVVGLGVQWNPYSYVYDPPAATLQLCIGRHCLIFQLLHSENVPLSLRRFLSDPRHTFVGVRNNSDEAKLLRSKHGLEIYNLVDAVKVAAERHGTSRRCSMESLAEIILGFEGVEKPDWIGVSAWDAAWLSEEQVQYACVDAHVSFELGKALQVWNWEE